MYVRLKAAQLVDLGWRLSLVSKAIREETEMSLQEAGIQT
jgi:hypothetical protein